jgi:hypothetical protein
MYMHTSSLPGTFLLREAIQQAFRDATSTMWNWSVEEQMS